MAGRVWYNDGVMEKQLTPENQLTAAFGALGIPLSSRQQEQFLLYAELLVSWNERMNLTAITDLPGIIEKHFADSCAAALYPRYLPQGSPRVIDVGTGAGFPGIPLKILFPSWQMTLLDALGKRIRFLEEVIQRLGLTDIEAVHSRAEDAAKLPLYRERFDLCVSRAVAPLPVLAEYTLPFLAKGGTLLAYKSLQQEDEVEDAGTAIRILGGRVKDNFSFTLPGSELPRRFIVIEKSAATPNRYPRKSGTASRDPLGSRKEQLPKA